MPAASSHPAAPMRPEDVVVVGESAPLRAFEGRLRSYQMRVRTASHLAEAETYATLSRRCVLVVGLGDLRRSHRPNDIQKMLLERLENVHVGLLIIWEADEALANVTTELSALVGNRYTDFVRVPSWRAGEREDKGWLDEGMMRFIKLVKAWRSKDEESLFDPETGRYDADRIADFLRVSLRRLAEGLGANYTTVQKTPAAAALQERLGPIGRVVELLRKFHGSNDLVRQWLNTPHRELGERAPLSVILEGRADVVRDMLEAAYAGIPS